MWTGRALSALLPRSVHDPSYRAESLFPGKYAAMVIAYAVTPLLHVVTSLGAFSSIDLFFRVCAHNEAMSIALLPVCRA